MSCERRILYCHCTYAKVVPAAVKAEVLERLSASGVAFDAVPDLCEMSARKDPELVRFAGAEGLRIAACFPRAVRWLFHAAGAPLTQQDLRIENMRQATAGEVLEGVLAREPSTDGAERTAEPSEGSRR